ncbi:class II holin family protein [Salmonella enterica]|uniref:class II holin family protein n=1 Tax=Salmonella enterica TaxID=28901 RepID=UPI00398C783C
MKSMDKLTTGVAYGTSAGSAGYWFLQLLDKVTPSQWAAIGWLVSLVFGLLTYLKNLYLKINEAKHKSARGNICPHYS